MCDWGHAFQARGGDWMGDEGGSGGKNLGCLHHFGKEMLSLEH